ncbi:hypothetical protein [Stappia sp.]|uniref:hypothetical protein n=1 Tax=Stappia sp. TaxID=1870903 RepID=UPI0032D929A8
MASIEPADQAHPPQGSALITAAMLTVALVDGSAKHLSADHSPLLIAWARYVSATVFVLPTAKALRGRKVFIEARLGAANANSSQ